MSPDTFLLVGDLDFTILGEHHAGRLWLHCTVHRWTPAVYRRVQRAGAFLSRQFKQDLWVCDNPAAPLLSKFLSRMGFAPHEPVVNQGVVRIAFRKPYSTNGKFL